MRVGLLSFHFYHHYGAVLQAYALPQAIEACALRLGKAVRAEYIDYRSPSGQKTTRLMRDGFYPRALLTNFHTLWYLPHFHKRQKLFDRFAAQRIPQSARRYVRPEDFRKAPPEYDLLLCGSDQIWNPFLFENGALDPCFFFQFDTETRKAAYGPSLGALTLPEEAQKALPGYLSGFSHLSAREQAGADILKAASGRTPSVVLDPTLLLPEEHWCNLAREGSSPLCTGERYLLCYFVSGCSFLGARAREYARKHNLRIRQLCGARRNISDADERIFDAGPMDFLSLFRHAECVFTDSFHGAVFSLLFQRRLYCGVRERGRAGNRIEELLRRLGVLEETAVYDNGEALHERTVSHPSVQQRLERLREESLGYLCRVLENR